MIPRPRFVWLIACLAVCAGLVAPRESSAQQSALERGLALFEEGKFAEAQAVYTKMIADDPRNARAFRERAMCRVRLGDLKGALPDANEALELDPRAAPAWSVRSVVRRRLKDLDGAWADIQKALELSPRYVSGFNNRGLVRADRGDQQGAIADYTRSIELDPKQDSAYINRATAKFALGDLRGAVSDYTKAIENGPKDPYSYAHRAECLQKLGDAAGARRDYQKAIALSPNYQWASTRLKALDQPAGAAGALDAVPRAPVATQVSVPARDETITDLDVRDPIAAGATTPIAVDAVRVSLPLDWRQGSGAAGSGGPQAIFRPLDGGAQAPLISIDQEGTPYTDATDLQRIVTRREAAIERANGGIKPGRDQVVLGGIPVTRWTWTTRENRTVFEYAVRNATKIYTVRAEAAGVVKVEPPAVRDVLDTLSVGGLAVDPELEAGANASATAAEAPAGKEPPAWVLDPDASKRIREPCGPGGEPATDPPMPPLPAGPPDLKNLQSTLAQSIDRLNHTQYAGAVSAAMQATRLLMGPLTPDEERRVFAAWAPLFDYPSDAVLAYLDKLNPLLVEFVALMRSVEAAQSGLEQAQYEAEMAAAYDHEAGTRAAMAAAMRFVGELKGHKARIEDVAARVAALGEPPDPLKEKCNARARTRRALEVLKTLPAPKAAPEAAPQTEPAGDDPPPEFMAMIPPSERAAYKGKGYRYWLSLPTRKRPETYTIHLNAFFHVQDKVFPQDGFALNAAVESGGLEVTDHSFSFTKEDRSFGSWKCPATGQEVKSGRNLVSGTLSDDGKTLLTLDVFSTYKSCREVCTHGPERIDKVTGQHYHRLTGEDTTWVLDQQEVHRQIVNLPLVRPMPMVYGVARRGASFEYAVRGPATRNHIRALTPNPPATFDATDKVDVTIIAIEPTSGGARVSAPEDPAKAARDQQVAFHQENIRLLQEDLARYTDLLSRAKDEQSRTFYQYMITSKGADLQAEADAITTIQTGNFTRTMTAWDAMVQGQMAAQSREMAAKTAAGASIYEHVDRLIDNLPEADRAKARRWAREQIYGDGDRAENAKRVGRSIAEQLQEINKGAAAAGIREAAWNDDVIANLEAVQTVANYSMYATPFVAGGGALALAYGVVSGTVGGYQTGGLLGEKYAGTLTGTTLAAVTTAARYWSPAIDYGLTFFEGYTAVDENGQQAGALGGVMNVAETFVKRQVVALGTRAVLARQARLEAARKAARLDEWRDAQRRVAFQQERDAGKALVEQHNRLYDELKDAKRAGGDPARVAELQNRLMDTTAAIKQSPHAKGYLKFGADAAQKAAYASTDRLHTARVLRDFKQSLQAEGFSLSGLTFKPIRNAGNTTPGMDLDMAVFTDLKRVTVRDPKTQAVTRIPLYEANERMQQVFDRSYARNSGGRSARASWQMVTTSKNLEAYEDMTWIRIKKIGREAGQVNPLRPGVKPVDPLSALDPRYAEGAARVTEIKADEIGQQAGMSRDNRNWEAYRGTSKDIKTKVLPLIAERLKTNLTASERQQVMQKYEFYKSLSSSMDLANHDPVAAERALKTLTGFQGAELVRLVSMGIETLGKFR